MSLVTNSSSPPPWLEEFSPILPSCSLCHNLSTDNCHHTGLVGNDTPQSMADPWSTVPELRLNLGVYILCMVGGLVGNIMVITVMVREKTSRTFHADTWKTNLFLLSLTLSDLLLVTIAVPTQLLQYFSVQVDESGAFCKISEYFRVLSSTAAILNLTAVTLERFVVIVYPMHSRSLCTLGNCRKVVMVVWVLSIFLALPVIFTKNVFTYYYANCTDLVSITYCNDTDDSIGIYFTLYQLVVTFLVPSIIMIICYSTVIKSLWKATQNMALMTNSIKANKTKEKVLQSSFMDRYRKSRRKDSTKDARRERKQVIKMLILVVILFLLCWGPRFIMETLLKMGILQFTATVYWIRVVLFLFPFIHAIVNPLIYVAMSKLFRNSLFKMMRELCCKMENQVDSTMNIENRKKISTRKELTFSACSTEESESHVNSEDRKRRGEQQDL